MNSIVEKNIELMTSSSPGGMGDLCHTESFGGNAGFFNGYPCYAASFYFDKDTGEIKRFGNFQDVSPDIRETYEHGLFKLALTITDNPPTLGDWIIRNVANPENPMAKSSLDETVATYNNRHGLEPITKDSKTND